VDKTLGPAPGLMTVDEAAQFLHLSRAKTYQMTQSGELPSVRFGRAVRIPKTAIDRLMEAPSR
jgi:excisionase family DNA binding protein